MPYLVVHNPYYNELSFFNFCIKFIYTFLLWVFVSYVMSDKTYSPHLQNDRGVI